MARQVVALFPFIQLDSGSFVGEAYLSVGVLIAGLGALYTLGLLIFDPEPDGDVLFGAVVGTLIVALFWGAVVVGGVFALLVLGARRLVHGAPKPPPEALQREIDRRERDLKVGSYAEASRQLDRHEFGRHEPDSVGGAIAPDSVGGDAARWITAAGKAAEAARVEADVERIARAQREREAGL